MKAFVLRRNEDVSGVSGLGIVAEGVEFADGRVALRWCVGEHRSTVTWDSMDAVRAIHGHDGRTVVEWHEVGDVLCVCEEYWPGQGHPPDCPTQLGRNASDAGGDASGRRLPPRPPGRPYA
ncbi:MAG: hypothetical protein KGL39_43420 [Patescibacteria group bacterium]|nr:hypothetical protein [Patescibacteria group bacterium]